MKAIPERKIGTCAFLTLGCKVNQADTEALRLDLTRTGWSVASSATRRRGGKRLPFNGADLYVINTCAVTSVAEAKSRRLIRRVGRLAPHSKIVVTGCYAQTKPEEIAQLPGVELVLPPAQENRLAELLGGTRLPNQPRPRAHRTRAILKIQDGCTSACSFCILPLIRGRPTSKSLEKVVKEAEELVQAGHKEIVLTGINLGQYGKDLPPVSLVDVLEQLIRIEGLKRIRLSSIELDGVTDRLLHLMRVNPKICPHLHIPLQGGSDKILEQMNRPYTAQEYLDGLSRVRERLDNPAITTDVMVGFPGETDEDFQSTLKVCQKAGFSKIHIFPYSIRPGTKAATLTTNPTLRVKPMVIKQRVKVLSELANSLALRYKEQFVGKVVEVLLEGEGKSGMSYTEVSEHLKTLRSAPSPKLWSVGDFSEGGSGFTERYLKVWVSDGRSDPASSRKAGRGDCVNQFVRVRVEKAIPERLIGRLVS